MTLSNLDLANDFVRVRHYVDDSHFQRSLLQCKDCGQLYFYEFYELVDWKKGNDPQYRTLIPVASEGEADKIKSLGSVQLLDITPRLQIDWPSHSPAPVVQWIGSGPAS